MSGIAGYLYSIYKYVCYDICLSVCVSVCLCVCLCVCVCVYIDSCNCCMLAPFDVKICTRVSCRNLLTPAKKFCELFIFHRDFREKNMFFTRFLCISHMCIFHEKIITFLFVTFWHMIGFRSTFCRRCELAYWIYTLKRPTSPLPRFFFLKTFHCTRTSKNWKIHDFFWLFSFVFILFSNSKIVRRTRFCGF